MKHPPLTRPSRGFTLVEVVISIGVLAVALSAIVTTISYSGRVGAESARRTQALGLAETAASDLGSAWLARQPQSGIHRISTAGMETGGELDTIYFTQDGVQVGTRQDAFFACLLTARTDDSVPGLTHLHTRITWPAAAREGREQGAVELLTSLADR